jgi:hypothetical protein
VCLSFNENLVDNRAKSLLNFSPNFAQFAINIEVIIIITQTKLFTLYKTYVSVFQKENGVVKAFLSIGQAVSLGLFALIAQLAGGSNAHGQHTFLMM